MKSEVHAKVLKVLGNDRFALLWWDLELPGLGMATPNEVWAKDPDRLTKYVDDYTGVDTAATT